MQVEELFVPVPDYPRYVVSNYGRIINVKNDREVTESWSDYADGLIVILKGGYQFDAVKVCDVVASAFFVEYFQGIDIYFKNDNKRDCTVLNLTFAKPETDDNG